MSNLKEEGKNNLWIKVTAIAGIVAAIAVVVTLFALKECRESIWNFCTSPVMSSGLGLIVALMSAVVSYLILKKKHMSALQLSVDSLEKNLTEIKSRLELKNAELAELKKKAVPHFKRFENITEIRYGHIDYPPLLYHDEQGNPHGIGIEILKKIFHKNGFVNDQLLMYWDDIDNLLNEESEENLGRYRIDIIATPIFETNERAQKVGFTSPIFFSEIGLYYSKESEVLNDLQPPMTFEKAIKKISYFRGIKFCVVDGELSERMVRKYFPDHYNNKECTKYKKDKMKIPELLGMVYEGKSDLAFVETFQADLLTKYKDKLINLLGPKQLLYPVAFALRKEDYILRRYINLKLLELDFCTDNGVLDLVKQELEKTNPTFFSAVQTEEKRISLVKKYFIREYDTESNSNENILRLENPSKNA